MSSRSMCEDRGPLWKRSAAPCCCACWPWNAALPYCPPCICCCSVALTLADRCAWYCSIWASMRSRSLWCAREGGAGPFCCANERGERGELGPDPRGAERKLSLLLL